MEITEDIFTSKIKEYTTSSQYTPLQITMTIRPPLYLNNPWLHFDSILSYLCLRDALDDLFYILPTEKAIDISGLDIPLKKTRDIYHSSIGIFQDIQLLKTDKIYKRFKQNYWEKKKECTI